MKTLPSVLALLLTTSCAAAAPPTGTVDPNTCKPVPAAINPAAQRAIGVNWAHYRPFMRLCPIKNSRSQTIMNILALDVPAAQKAGSLEWVDGKPWTPDSTANSDPVPLPIVFDRARKPVAIIPKNLFPLLPNRGTIVFSHWRNDIPQQITVSSTFPNTGPNPPLMCLPPFIWNQATHRYRPPATETYHPCRHANK